MNDLDARTLFLAALLVWLIVRACGVPIFGVYL